MKPTTEYFAGALTTLTLFAGSLGATGLRNRPTQESGKADRQVIATQNKFYCNSKALTAEERAHHKRLGDKLTQARKALVETEKGYEFQFSPSDVTLAEEPAFRSLGGWLYSESIDHLRSPGDLVANSLGRGLSSRSWSHKMLTIHHRLPS